MQYIAKSDLDNKPVRLTKALHRKQSNFARGIAASEFGGRYFGWREWGEFDSAIETVNEAQGADLPLGFGRD